MGGFGSGAQNGKRCTDDLWALDVRSIYKTSRMWDGNSFTWQWTVDGVSVAKIYLEVGSHEVVLDYRRSSEYAGDSAWEHLRYAVRLDLTSCALGGRRVWWLCPGVSCGRRVAILYGGRHFLCRDCNRLAYRSQREASDDGSMRRARAIRRRLGWAPGILNDDGGKPRHMHWTTYWRLRSQHNDAVRHVLIAYGAHIEELKSRLGLIK